MLFGLPRATHDERLHRRIPACPLVPVGPRPDHDLIPDRTKLAHEVGVFLPAPCRDGEPLGLAQGIGALRFRPALSGESLFFLFFWRWTLDAGRGGGARWGALAPMFG